MGVDLGSGSKPRNPLRCAEFFGIDIIETPPFRTSSWLHYVRVDPGEPLPFESNSVDVCSAFDFLEHIPRFVIDSEGKHRNHFIEMMNEISRILRPGGLFIAATPSYPHAAAFGDPTHVNFITKETHEYFSGPTHAHALDYGYSGKFSTILVDWLPWDSCLWRTFEPLERDTTIPWALLPARRGLSKVRAVFGRGIRAIGFRRGVTPVHLLWILQKME